MATGFTFANRVTNGIFAGMTAWRISADTGGTFTDAFAVDPQGRESRCKVLSSGVLRARVRSGPVPEQLQLEGLPDLPVEVLRGFSACANGEVRRVLAWDPGVGLVTLEAAFSVLPERLDLATGEEAPVLAARLLTGTPGDQALPLIDLRLATTRATNALLEHKGSPVALFVTLGFGDLLRLGDQRRADLFALQHAPRPCFYEAVVEVTERVSVEGTVLIPLDEASLAREASRLRAQGLRHAAVALLHSHAHPAHEQRVAAILRQAGFEQVSVSAEVAPFAKILPRAQSAVANAYLTGPVQAFLAGVGAPLGAGSHLSILTSAGALERAQDVRPKDLLLSGPAGGALGAANAAARAGYSRVLTLDMGGTSTDVARIDGRPGLRFSQEVAGLRLLAPCVAIETVAAGGGSICRWTPQGLAVGPESAGADPGPACYGRGGPLTITDVNLLLGRFDPARAPIPLAPARGTACRLRRATHARGTAAGLSASRGGTHGGCDPAHLGGRGLRSARSRPARLRRCRTAACLRGGGTVGHDDGAGARARWHSQRGRTA